MNRTGVLTCPLYDDRLALPPELSGAQPSVSEGCGFCPPCASQVCVRSHSGLESSFENSCMRADGLSKARGRRAFVKSIVGASAAVLTGTSAFSASGQDQTPPSATPRRAAGLPSRGEYLVRSGHILTMDAGLGDVPGGDVHVRNGEIIAVGKNLKALSAQILDASRMIVLP